MYFRHNMTYTHLRDCEFKELIIWLHSGSCGHSVLLGLVLVPSVDWLDPSSCLLIGRQLKLFPVSCWRSPVVVGYFRRSRLLPGRVAWIPHYYGTYLGVSSLRARLRPFVIRSGNLLTSQVGRERFDYVVASIAGLSAPGVPSFDGIPRSRNYIIQQYSSLIVFFLSTGGCCSLPLHELTVEAWSVIEQLSFTIIGSNPLKELNANPMKALSANPSRT